MNDTYGDIPSDHFYDKFNRHEEGQPRFEAVAQHAAMLLNQLQKETELRRVLLETIVDKMKEQDPKITLVLDLQEQLYEMRER